jgi:hypothetical protein
MVPDHHQEAREAEKIKPETLAIGLMTCFAQKVSAQFGYYQEALLFSQTQFGGTARIMGVGGAQIALGGDLSLANSNPAGLGFFNRSVFSITPAIDFHNSQSTYLNDHNSQDKVNFNLNQLGISFYIGDGELGTGAYRGGSFAINVSKVNEFNNTLFYEGTNNDNSIINAMLAAPDQGIVDGAYENFLLNAHPYNYIFDEEFGEIVGFDTIPGFDGLSSPFDTSVPLQSEQIKTLGGQYSIDLAYGGNVNDFLYFGGGLGIQTINYERISTYREWDYFVVTERFPNGDVNGFPDDALDNIKIVDRLEIEGIGVNGKLGLTVRPVQFLTLGLAYETPTIMSLTEEGSYDFNATYFEKYDYTVVTIDEDASDPDDRYVFETFELGEHEFLSDIYTSTYTLKTPGKLNLGMAVFLGKRGFITGDVEFVDYEGIHLNSSEFDMGGDNQVVQDLYTTVMNYRTGIELRFNTIKLRGGYAVQNDAYQTTEFDRTSQLISGGIGFRNEGFFVDLTGMYKWSSEYKSPYSISENQPIASIDVTKVSALLSLGLVF